MTAYRLYWNRNTGAFAPNAALILVDAPFERIRIDSHKGENRKPDYMATSPLGQIPALRLPDGTIMTESAAILLHLAEAFPEAGLAPMPESPERPLFLRWLLFLAVNAYDAELRISYPDRYTADPAGAPAVKEGAKQDLDRYWTIVEQAVHGPFFLGSRLSALDLYAAMLAKWYGGLDDKPRVSAILEGVRSHPRIEALWEEYFA